MQHWLSNCINNYRRRLIHYDSILAYSVLGVVGGVASGLIALAFELGIREFSIALGVGDSGNSFETLPHWMIFALPAGGATLLGCAYTLLKPKHRETGIVHVLSRMHSHYSILPLRNAAVQFFGGVFALATGQSGGREGPGVHLGGAINSMLGQLLGLPNNSLRMLIACGTAGGIAAAFQTPLAGVLFAMEVIIAEYSVAGFIPVMLAAVSASAVSRTLSADDWLFSVPPLQLNSLLELPYVILLELCCGTAVAAFVRISTFAARFSAAPIALRFAVAGVITGSLAMLAPEILGMGYDTLTLAIHGDLTLSVLLVIAVCKLLATAVSCGVGMPMGLIGPNLLIGACIGGLLGTAGSALLPGLVQRDGDDLYLVRGSELLAWLSQTPFEGGTVDISGAGIRRWTVSPLPIQATLRQAVDTMHSQTTEAVCVHERSPNTGKQILHGVVTLESIEKYTLASMTQ